MAWGHARNDLGILLPLSPREGWREGIQYIKLFRACASAVDWQTLYGFCKRMLIMVL